MDYGKEWGCAVGKDGEHGVLSLRQKLNDEKKKLHKSMKETQNITVNGFPDGFSRPCLNP
ncbi:hypothetical protein GBA52_025278 [Prunus armeniaca]|nr:hypothetical protein GBA52_025278 [Prunus armeniaca]